MTPDELKKNIKNIQIFVLYAVINTAMFIIFEVLDDYIDGKT